MGILADIGFTGIQQQVQASLPQNRDFNLNQNRLFTATSGQFGQQGSSGGSSPLPSPLLNPSRLSHKVGGSSLLDFPSLPSLPQPFSANNIRPPVSNSKYEVVNGNLQLIPPLRQQLPRQAFGQQAFGQPSTGLTIQDRIAQMLLLQKKPSNPFITSGFPNFPTQGQQPSFNNPLAIGGLPQGSISSKGL